MSWGASHWLWLLALAPLAGAVAWALWKRRLRWLRAWASRALWSRLAVDFDRRVAVASAVCLALAAAGLAIGLAQPRWGTIKESVERQGVDVVFVLDSSLSMAAADVEPSRLFVAQQLVRRLVQEMPGNRVALVQVEGDGLVLSPLTVDSAVIDLVLETVGSGSLPTPGTNLAKSIQLATELFPEGSQKHRVIVLISDGEDHVGGLDEYTDELVQQGVTLHALGVGTAQGAPIPLADAGGRYKKDEGGQVVISKLHEESLRELADATGGKFETITTLGAPLGRIVDAVQGMEKRRIDGETVVAQEERFQWPLLLALLALVGWFVFDPFAPEPEEAA